MRRELCSLSIALLLFGACSREEKKPEPLTYVETEVVAATDVPITLETMGSMCSPKVVRVKPQVSGKLEKIFVEPGKFVKKGDLLFEIEKKPFIAAVDQAKACLKKDRACLEFAKKKKARYEDLVKKEFISQLAFEEYERDVATCTAQVQKDIADLDAAKINLEYCTIKADQAGRISHFKADPGNLVTSQEPLNEIRQLNPINVRFQIAERDFQKIKHLKNLSVNVLQESGDSHLGKIHFIDNHINDETGTILMKAEIKNKDLALWPGEFVKVRLHLRTRENAILIPKSALQYDTKGPFVFLTSDDSVKKQHVTLAETVGDKIVVIEGLTNNDKIVTKGALNLTDGKKVAIKK